MQFAASTFGIVWRRALGNTSRPATYCHRVAVHRHKEYGMLEPLPRPKRPFETITLDFITGSPSLKRRIQVFPLNPSHRRCFAPTLNRAFTFLARKT